MFNKAFAILQYALVGWAWLVNESSYLWFPHCISNKWSVVVPLLLHSFDQDVCCLAEKMEAILEPISGKKQITILPKDAGRQWASITLCDDSPCESPLNILKEQVAVKLSFPQPSRCLTLNILNVKQSSHIIIRSSC